MSPLQDLRTQRLLQFSIDVLEQALVLVAAYDRVGPPDYATPIGAHLRHVIEHYEALLSPTEPGRLNYDQRPRDRELERLPAVARVRLQALQARLMEWTDAQLDAPLQVHGLAGLAGDFEFAVESSVGRELVFVASHAIHHYALLQAYCLQQGIPTGSQFGRAPATVAHARSTPSVSLKFTSKETSCNA